MSNSERELIREELIKELMASERQKPWREMTIQRMMGLSLKPGDHLELRVIGDEEGDVFALARRGVSAFFTAFSLYPSSVAAHSSVASLFEAAEMTFKAEHHYAKDIDGYFGEGFEARLIPIEVDDGLDIKTVAVRFSISFEDYKEAAMNVILRALAGGNDA